MRLAVGARLGPYEIIAPLGAGGMGEVYRARDTRLDRTVAIKILPESLAGDPQFRERFDREARAISQLTHPHICTLYDVGEQAGTAYLVMEFLEGETLVDRLRRGPLAIGDAFRIAIGIADGLAAAHRAGIVHRDLKPGNVMVTKSGAKLLDFGLAKTGASATAAGVSTLTTTANLTAQGVILGTVAYMAPELLQGHNADARSDMFAMGAVLYELFTGRKAFEGTSQASLIAAIISNDPPPVSQRQPVAPAALDHLVATCLQKDPDERWQSARDVAGELRWLAQSGLSVDRPASTARERSRWRWLSVAPWLIAGTLGAALVASIYQTRAEQTTRAGLSISRDNTLTVEGGVAISPDGRTLAFSGRGDRGLLLYVRRLDEWWPREIPQTDGATSPFFSPDGKWIAFAQGWRLKKVPVGGGPPQPICEGGSNRNSVYGGQWQSDGTIVFGTWPAALWRVSADGGTPRLITRPNEGSDLWYLWPETLPDGRGILFTIWQGGRTSIAVLPEGADKPQIVVPSGGRQRYLSTGHLVYVADGHLFAVPFDLDSKTIRGGATVVIDDINETPLTSDYDVSEDGNLVYLPAGSAAYDVVWKDRHGLATPLDEPPRRYTAPALSPDGERFSVNVTEGASRSIWTRSVRKGVLTRLTFGNDDVFGLWSRDGKQLVYSAGQYNYNLFRIATDGSGSPEQLTKSLHAQYATSFSPDGETILLNDVEPMGSTDIWEFSLSRKEALPLVKTRYHECCAMFSMDGRWIAYQSNESGPMEIYVQAYPRLTGKRRVSLEGGEQAFWGHTGRELFYQTATAMFAIPIEDAGAMRTGTARQLFLKASITQGGKYSSPDDQHFLMIERAKSSQSPLLKVVQNWFKELRASVPTR